MSKVDIDELGFFKSFYALLLEEAALLSKILLVEKDKASAFSMSGSFIDLDCYNDRLGVLVENQKVLERTRLGYLGELSVVKGSECSTLKDVLTYVPEGLQDSYIKIENELNRVVDEIKLVNSSNAVIIQDSLKLLGYGLSMFREERELEINYKERDKSSTRYRPIIVNTVI